MGPVQAAQRQQNNNKTTERMFEMHLISFSWMIKSKILPLPNEKADKKVECGMREPREEGSWQWAPSSQWFQNKRRKSKNSRMWNWRKYNNNNNNDGTKIRSHRTTHNSHTIASLWATGIVFLFRLNRWLTYPHGNVSSCCQDANAPKPLLAQSRALLERIYLGCCEQAKTHVVCVFVFVYIRLSVCHYSRELFSFGFDAISNLCI